MKRVPAWLWLWGAPAIVVLQIAVKAWNEELYRRTLRGERGLVENLTVLFLLGALVCAWLCFRERAAVRSRLFGPFALALALGLFFFAGEEASWGQHWLGYVPPEVIASRNDQGEFNLHNDPVFEKVLDQLPRTLLTLAALVGSIAALARRGRERDFQDPRPFGWMWPPLECVPAALVALTVTVPEKVAEALGTALPAALDISPGETKEYALALFLLVYMLSLRAALRAEAPAPSASPVTPRP